MAGGAQGAYMHRVLTNYISAAQATLEPQHMAVRTVLARRLAAAARESGAVP